jgi:hypothetical protein
MEICLPSKRHQYRMHRISILAKGCYTLALALGVAFTSMPASSQESDSQTLVQARALLGSAHWQDAEPLVKSYLEAHPDAAEAHLLMGQILYRQNQPRPSMAEYVKASETIDLSAFDLRIFALDCAAIPDLPEAEKWLRSKRIARTPRTGRPWGIFNFLLSNTRRLSRAWSRHSNLPREPFPTSR